MLWEFWNYWAIGKWIYTVPIPFAGPKIFEMPLLGFLGFPAFAVEVYSLQNFIIEKRLLVGRLTVADATSLSKETRRQLIEIAKKYCFKVVIIVLDIPLEICIERDKKRPRKVGEL